MIIKSSNDKDGLLLVTKEGKVIHTGAGSKRITSRFVKYPYPPVVSTTYNKEFAKKKPGRVDHNEAFNLEKEPKPRVHYDFNGNSSHIMDFQAPKLDLSAISQEKS
jgi:hypothetical protein